MKHLKFLTLVFAASLLLVACQDLGNKSLRSERTQRTLVGTYVNYAEGQYSVAYDTLLVQALDAGSNAYRIYRNTAFRRIESGKLQKLERRNHQWTAVYDETTGTMLESQKGRVLSVYPDSGVIVIGSREYRKVEKE
jgi:hypothetical protein